MPRSKKPSSSELPPLTSSGSSSKGVLPSDLLPLVLGKLEEATAQVRRETYGSMLRQMNDPALTQAQARAVEALSNRLKRLLTEASR